MIWTTKALLGFALLFLLTLDGSCADAPIDKSKYHLFNPTPTEYLREMTIDGPGATESAYTVDAGHFQVEMTLFSYSSYREPFVGGDYRLDWWTVGPINLKLGLLNRLDVQVVLEPYNHVRETDGFTANTYHGIGDTTLRFKFNVWGNDGGRMALALTPFVRFPTSAEGVGSDSVEGGLFVPFETELPREFFLGVMTGVEGVRNLTGPGHHAEFVNSIVLHHQLFGDLDGFAEFFSAASTERDVGWVGTFNTGLSYWLSDDLLLNAGVDLGVTDAADDWFAFAGLAWRF